MPLPMIPHAACPADQRTSSSGNARFAFYCFRDFFLSNFRAVLDEQRESARMEASDDQLRGARDVLVSENALLGGFSIFLVTLLGLYNYV